MLIPAEASTRVRAVPWSAGTARIAMIPSVRDRNRVLATIRSAFRDTEHPGDTFLQGSFEGTEPREVAEAFSGVREWSQLDTAVLDAHYAALGFLSDGGFRFFLPAYLVADLEGGLQTADPVFYLTHGFSDDVPSAAAGSRTHDRRIEKSTFVNPRRFGAMTWYDYARKRLSVFTREEAGAVVSYLEYRRDLDTEAIDVQAIEAALESFWYERATSAPDHAALRRDIEAGDAYVRDLTAPPEQ